MSNTPNFTFHASQRHSSEHGLLSHTNRRHSIFGVTAPPMQTIENLDSLTQLQQLWLGRNRISEIANLRSLTNVRQLSLQANRLESMAGVGVMLGLEELYLSQNGIKRMEDLAPLTKLTVLDLAQNAIEKVQTQDSCTARLALYVRYGCAKAQPCPAVRQKETRIPCMCRV
jgi:protein phosphatase 1 regulatory subunit 7